MDINRMRNIVILKDLPSNIVDEAFIVLKKNQKIKRFEYADNKFENFSNENSRDNEEEYVVKEAELLVSNYIDNLEKSDVSNKNAGFIKKYKYLKIASTLLGIAFIISIFTHF